MKNTIRKNIEPAGLVALGFVVATLLPIRSWFFLPALLVLVLWLCLFEGTERVLRGR